MNKKPLSKKKRASDTKELEVLEKEQKGREQKAISDGLKEARKQLRGLEEERKKECADRGVMYRRLFSASILKKQRVINIVLEKVRTHAKIVLGEILREAGYSQSYSEHPDQVFKKREFLELFSERISDDKLTRVHGELLEAGNIQHYTFPARLVQKTTVDKKGKRITGKAGRAEDISDEEIKEIVESVPGCKLIYIKADAFLGGKTAYFQSPDNKSRKDALDMGYKVGGKYAPEKFQVTRKYAHLTDEELAARIRQLRAKYNKK